LVDGYLAMRASRRQISTEHRYQQRFGASQLVSAVRLWGPSNQLPKCRFRRSAEEARARMRDDFRFQVQDFHGSRERRVAAASSEHVDAMKARTKRLSEKLADNSVDETLEAYDVDETLER
jgi:hypothetical protein